MSDTDSAAQTCLRHCLEEDSAGACIAGVDEVGRGPLAGDVLAAAVIMSPQTDLPGLDDSKRLSPGRRDQLYDLIRTQALSWSVGRASVEEIDQINILQASLLAMHRAVQGLAQQPELVYVDGNRCPHWHYHSRAVVRGDSRIVSIAAASIIAKVTRDREMIALDAQYPGYGFAGHKGYPSKSHLEALARLGPTAIHRRTFGPVARLLQTVSQKTDA